MAEVITAWADARVFNGATGALRPQLPNGTACTLYRASTCMPLA